MISDYLPQSQKATFFDKFSSLRMRFWDCFIQIFFQNSLILFFLGQTIGQFLATYFTPICGYFYLRIFLSVDIFIRGYFCNKIKNWCKKSLFHHIYVIKLLLSMLYAFKADILHSIFKFLILLQKYPRIKISTDKNIRR